MNSYLSSASSSPFSVIVLCDVYDSSAFWLAAELQLLGLRCEIVLGPVLGAASRFEHRIDLFGRTSVAISLPDGRNISSETPVPIINRLTAPPIEKLHATGGADFGYAMQEVSAMHLSWLYGWPATVINRPCPQGFCGNFRHPSAWIGVAKNAGLAVVPWQQSAKDAPDAAWTPRQVEAHAFVIGRRAILAPELPDALGDACVAVGSASGSALIGIDFVRSQDRTWRFCGASPFPMLQKGGSELVTALAELLR